MPSLVWLLIYLNLSANAHISCAVKGWVLLLMKRAKVAANHAPHFATLLLQGFSLDHMGAATLGN
jgi:hypothetical protein